MAARGLWFPNRAGARGTRGIGVKRGRSREVGRSRGTVPAGRSPGSAGLSIGAKPRPGDRRVTPRRPAEAPTLRGAGRSLRRDCIDPGLRPHCSRTGSHPGDSRRRGHDGVRRRSCQCRNGRSRWHRCRRVNRRRGGRRDHWGGWGRYLGRRGSRRQEKVDRQRDQARAHDRAKESYHHGFSLRGIVPWLGAWASWRAPSGEVPIRAAAVREGRDEASSGPPFSGSRVRAPTAL
jgi:hypothetical protein